VAQRFELRAKGAAGAPHLLVMTATPIPRTLALTAYGDLDVTVLDEMPPGRVPPRTLVLSGAAGRERAQALVRQRLAAGERAYVVCPLIEPGDADGPPRADAVTTAERLQHTFAPARVGLVHGRMPQAEREQAMTRFRDGTIDILVATTVIEVGVDVPAATVMVILDAHCFGLAQLHQLRGRIGRGGGASHCLLMTRGRKTPEAARRLAIMAETGDGFRIAEEDLRMRGPGELLGARQAGLPRLRFGDVREHGALLVQARDAAEALLADDPALARPQHAMTRRVLERRTRDAEIYGPESG
jgi:ATP-dependent DNA helicase RecG